MRGNVRLAVIVAVTLASSAAWTGTRADDDPSVPAEGAAAPAEDSSAPAKEVFEPGAASTEPAQAIEEDPGTKAHRAWVESIWTSP